MKVEIKIDRQCEETTVIIMAKEISDEVNELAKMLSNPNIELIVGFKDNNAAIVGIEKIIRIYAASQKVYIVASDGEYTSRLRLYEFEERLPRNVFVRTSNSEIVNLQKVKDFDLSFSGSICVRFIDGSTTYVSRRYVAKIKTMLGI
ncbi:MAG: LytTR family transcriptional regulator [Christensenellaceae bacterium]|nr:LytTR family transcriptional regulator [Christensenellaceae bacterium]